MARPRGVQYNVNPAMLAGCVKYYDQPYRDATTASDINNAPASAKYIFVGAQDPNGNIKLGAFGARSTVLRQTYTNSPNENNGVYWYFTNGKSFGFAGSSSISQSSADTLSGSHRLSWHLTGGSGGYRAGDTTSLSSSSSYRKLLYACDIDAKRQRRDDNEVPVCKCDDGQYWNVTGLHCSTCPADTYSDNVNTIADYSDTYDGYRLQCTDCPHLYVSAEGSSGIGSCSPAYALESTMNKFCSQSTEGAYPPKGSKGLPLRPILDRASCMEAATTLNKKVYSGGVNTAQCVDEEGTCDTHKNKDNDYYKSNCGPNAPKIKAADGSKKRLRDVCKVSCKTCLVNSQNPTKPPRGCALIGGSVRLFPDDYDESQLFWDGSDYNQLCKVAPCGKTKGFDDLQLYAQTRDSTSYCEPSGKARKAEEDEAYVAFYLTVCGLVLVIELLGGCYLANKESVEPKDILFVFIVGVRSFDMMSDWAFYSISLRPVNHTL